MIIIEFFIYKTTRAGPNKGRGFAADLHQSCTSTPNTIQQCYEYPKTRQNTHTRSIDLQCKLFNLFGVRCRPRKLCTVPVSRRSVG